MTHIIQIYQHRKANIHAGFFLVNHCFCQLIAKMT